ncbi:hypothetical protein C8R44DRAFT_773413 [Mycena epipterygia]|nr:hypothetical protein C8R44DRAFT_773413 [Mycena epipterygia]
MSAIPGVPSPVQLQQTFGVIFTGTILSMIGYGFTFFQSYVYFSQYPADHWSLRSFVATIFALDTVATALLSESTYVYMVGSLPYFGGLVQIKSNFNINLLFSVMVVFATHLFFALRIWKLSRNGFVTGLTVLLSIVAFGFGIAMVTMIFDDPLFANLALVGKRVVISLACTFTILASLLIFIGLTGYSRKFSTLKPLSFDNISLYLLPRGLAGTLIQLGCLLTFVSLPHRIYWIPLYLVGTKVSVNALLTMLNSRESHNGKGLNEEDTLNGSRPRVGASTIGTGTTVSQMFHSGPRSEGIEISRNVEHDNLADNFTKGPYHNSSISLQEMSPIGDVKKNDAHI